MQSTRKNQPKGRTSITGKSLGKSPTSRKTANEQKTQTSRAIGSGSSVRRGDRRDTHPSFSTGKVSRDGGRAGPLGKATRKGGPKPLEGHGRPRGK